MMRTLVEVTVLTGIEMNELQKEVAGALYWLRMLIMAVTEARPFALLALSSFSGLGAHRADPHKVKRENTVKLFMT